MIALVSILYFLMDVLCFVLIIKLILEMKESKVFKTRRFNNAMKRRIIKKHDRNLKEELRQFTKEMSDRNE